MCTNLVGMTLVSLAPLGRQSLLCAKHSIHTSLCHPISRTFLLLRFSISLNLISRALTYFACEEDVKSLSIVQFAVHNTRRGTEWPSSRLLLFSKVNRHQLALSDCIF